MTDGASHDNSGIFYSFHTAPSPGGGTGTGYSSLSASTGATPADRLAGIQLASAATPTSSSGSVTKVSGSVVLT